MYELRALQLVDLSHNQLSTIGEHFERMINLHTLDLSGNPNIDPDELPIRTRRLHEKVFYSLPIYLFIYSFVLMLLLFSNNY